MAEVFGVVAGAISIAALFNNCIDCFDYIQIARDFGQDFPTYQLRLDIAKCRLTRWGAAIDINNDPRFASVDPTVSLAQDTLRAIVERLETAYKASLLYQMTSKEHDMTIGTEKDLDIVSKRLHNRFRGLTAQRINRVGLIKKAYWAVYDKKNMGKMIDDIFELMNDLEKVFPATNQATNQVVQMEVDEVDDQQELKMIQDAAKDLDPILEDTTKCRLQEIAGKNTAGRIVGPGHVSIGHTFVKESFVSSNGFRDNTVNHVEEIRGVETTRVNIGNTYGGKGFWD
ncbi:HETS protein [Fusarium beomiforme]|uniref:HETS protein n=1 Tax=Fusarium beomiforme TaxID=44412 RepID=A0A9P5A721_9HYPO|nr:HETS protein [Fusarium beomiforme]